MNWKLKKIITKDGINLEGIFFLPPSHKNKGILFIHGFTGNFYSNIEILNALAERLGKFGFGVASFNTRGHDIISWIRCEGKKEKKLLILGGAFEKFEDCILDIEAGLKFLHSQGFNDLILIGISTGADKVAYYLSKPHSKLIRGAVFLSPADNILIGRKELGKKLDTILKKTKRMIKIGKKNELILDPLLEFPISYHRFFSLYQEGSNENVFVFHSRVKKSKVLSRIKEPIFLILGEKDRYLYNYSPQFVIRIIKRNIYSSFKSAVIKDAGHNFKGKEKKLANLIANWIKKL